MAMPRKQNPKTTSAPRSKDSDSYARDLIFFINNDRIQISDPDPAILLVDYLRSPEVGLMGTKKSCGQGGCGACTVLLSSYDATAGKVVNRSINSCLRPICSLDGM